MMINISGWKLYSGHIPYGQQPMVVGSGDAVEIGLHITMFTMLSN